MIQDLEKTYLKANKLLKELTLLCLSKKRSRVSKDLIIVNKNLQGKKIQDTKLFTMKGITRNQLQLNKFQLNIRQLFLTEKVINPQNTFPKEWVDYFPLLNFQTKPET